MKQSSHSKALCALLCSTYLNQEKLCVFMAFSVSSNIKDNYILSWGTVMWQNIKILLNCQKAVFQFSTFLVDDSDLAPSKLCSTRGCGFWLSCWGALSHHWGAAPSPFWGLSVTSSHNKSSTTEKHLIMHFVGKPLTHFFSFLGNLLWDKARMCPPWDKY